MRKLHYYCTVSHHRWPTKTSLFSNNWRTFDWLPVFFFEVIGYLVLAGPGSLDAMCVIGWVHERFSLSLQMQNECPSQAPRIRQKLTFPMGLTGVVQEVHKL